VKPVVREIVLVYVGVAVATFLVTRLSAFEATADYVHLAVGGIFLLSAMTLAQREPDGMRRYGIDLAGVLSPPDEEDAGFLGYRELARTIVRAAPDALREIGVALAIAAVVFPPFVVGFAAYYRPIAPFVPTLPEDATSFALAQVLVVGLPEEALFRGYFQTRLSDVFTRRVNVLGVELSIPAIVVQAALFALVHFIVDFAPERLAVFFPGLLFGCIRSWRGGIGAAIVFHALSNFFADVLTAGWL
jgi:membrane protease YdiL (CAAX protease family)